MNKNHISVYLFVAILVVFSLIFFYQSGYVSKIPTVEATADNCYADTLHVIADLDYRPYSFYDEKGDFSGYDVELVTLVANRLNMNLDIRFMEWNDCISTIVTGGADLLMTCDYSDSFAGTDKLFKSSPTSTDEFTVYSKKRVSTVSALNGKRIAIMENGNVAPLMEILGLAPYCIQYRDNRAAMEALVDGEVDYAVMRQAVGVTLLEDLHASGIKAYISAGQSYMCYGINSDKPALAAKINEALEELKLSGEFDRLTDKWLTTFVRPYTFEEVLSRNIWIVVLFILLVTLLIYAVFRNKKREIVEQKEAQRHLAIEQNNRRIMALEDHLESLYEVELESGKYIEYVKGDFYRQNITDRLVREGDFFVDIRGNIEVVIYPEDRDALNNVLARENIRQALASSDRIEHYYRIFVGDTPVWFKIRIVYKDAEQKSLIIGCFNASTELEAKQIEERNARIAEEQRRNDIIHDIIHSGKWSFFLNGQDEIVRAEFSEKLGRLINYDLPKEPHAWKDIIHPEDLETTLAAFNATIADHSGNTPYDVVYRMRDRNGEYHWFHSAGKVVRDSDGNGEFFGVHIDVTESVKEQQRRLLGAIPMSLDVLSKEDIGLWSFELDEGKAPRMYADETMLKLLGLEKPLPPEEIYHAWYDNIDKDSYALVEEAVNKMIAGEHSEAQYPWHHPSGKTMIVRCGGVRNPEYTKGVRIEGTHQDMTQTRHYDEEQKKYERIKQSMNMFFTLSSEFDPIIVVEPETGEYDWYMSLTDDVNANTTSAARGANLYKSIGIDGASIVHEEDRARFQAFYSKENMMEIARTGISRDIENRWFDQKEDRYKWKYSKAVRMVDEEGRTYVVIGVMDTTAAKAKASELAREKEIAHQQLEEALQKAEVASMSKSSFLFNMSHDIRTPLNAITGFTTMAKKYANDPVKVADYLEKIDISGQQLLMLINKVLEMSRIESGKIEFIERHVNIKERFDAMVTIVADQARSAGLEFSSQMRDIEHYHVLADDTRMSQITLNVVGNAIKYTPEGGRIDFTLREIPPRKEGRASFVFTVVDTGIGMSEEFQKNLYEPFERENNSTVSKIQGTGLGMSIVKSLVDLADGSISVKSEPGRGSQFDIILDFKIADPAEESSSDISDNRNLSFKFQGKRALLVEDNEMNREIARFILEEKGVEIETAEDGDIAVRIMDELAAEGRFDHFDFILMDVQMPRMNGYEATGRIRKILDPLGVHLPIIALSANAFEEDRQKSIEAGMDGHIAKPIDVGQLWETLARFL